MYHKHTVTGSLCRGPNIENPGLLEISLVAAVSFLCFMEGKKVQGVEFVDGLVGA